MGHAPFLAPFFNGMYKQFWVNLNKLKHVDDKFKLSVGSEVELSQNFGARKGFYAIPTLAIKWSFD